MGSYQGDEAGLLLVCPAFCEVLLADAADSFDGFPNVCFRGND